MHEEKTTKQDRSAGGADIQTSSPYGQEEMEQAHIAEETGTDTPPDQVLGKKTPPVHTVQKQSQNPKHTGRSPREADPDQGVIKQSGPPNE